MYVLPIPLFLSDWQTVSRENQPPEVRATRALNILENYLFVYYKGIGECPLDEMSPQPFHQLKIEPKYI